MRKFTLEAERLCIDFSRFVRNNDLRQGQFAGEMTVIRLHDSWARFCRQLIILSAYGKTSTLGGMKLSTSLPSIKSKADVIPVLITLYPKKRTEPNWYASSECIDAGQRLRIQNLSSVAAALGAVNSPADRLRNIRNFYAHRREETARKAIQAGNFTGPHSPRVFQLNAFTTGGGTVLESWKDELIAIATAALQ